MVDALGNPLKFILIAGQRNDLTQAEALIEDIVNPMLLADKRYDSNALIEQLQTQICIAVIPPKKNRNHQKDYDEHVYKERHLIECSFRKIKYLRRVFSRFDKTTNVFM